MQSQLTEQKKVSWVIANTVLNGFGHENYRLTEDPTVPEYNYWEEAMLWAKSRDYFPDLSEDEFLIMARKYDDWNDFEKGCVESGCKK